MCFTYNLTEPTQQPGEVEVHLNSSHFPDEDTGAQSSERTHPRVPHQAHDSDEMNPGSSHSRALNLGDTDFVLTIEDLGSKAWLV